MRPRQFTDQELLETARRHFLEYGPGVSTATIADALGVTPAALFKRFKTKHSLMVHALAPTSHPAWIDDVRAGPDDRPVIEQLHDVVTAIDAFFEELLPCIAVLRSAGVDPEQILRGRAQPGPTVAHQALEHWFRRLHEAGRAHVPLCQSTAMAFLGAIHARHMLSHVLGEHAPQTEPEFLHNLVTVFWAGIDPVAHATTSGDGEDLR